MRVIVLLGLALVAAEASVEIQGDYHETIGIPLAEKIRLSEEQQLDGIVSRNERVVGGSIAPANAHPYFAGLLINLVGIAGNSVCGANLLSNNRLVTAAHCWRDRNLQAWQFTVILGSNLLFSGGTRIATSQVIEHPLWDPPTLNNDVAMIYLPWSVSFTANISPVDLPTNTWDTFVGEWAVAAGFGRTSDHQVGASTIVSHVRLQVISVLQCQMIFGSTFVRPSTLCTNGASGVGVCGGDSGGPLVVTVNGRPTLIGISSFVASNGCTLGFPSAFARVTSFTNFIRQHM